MNVTPYSNETGLSSADETTSQDRVFPRNEQDDLFPSSAVNPDLAGQRSVHCHVCASAHGEDP
jgi:hypothetical protein